MTRKEFEQKVKDEKLRMVSYDIELDHYYLYLLHQGQLSYYLHQFFHLYQLMD